MIAGAERRYAEIEQCPCPKEGTSVWELKSVHIIQSEGGSERILREGTMGSKRKKGSCPLGVIREDWKIS